MPRAVVDLDPKRSKLWLRNEIERWARSRMPVRMLIYKSRPAVASGVSDK